MLNNNSNLSQLAGSANEETTLLNIQDIFQLSNEEQQMHNEWSVRDDKT